MSVCRRFTLFFSKRFNLNCRWTFCVYLMFGTAISFGLGASFNVSLVAMVSKDMWRTETLMTNDCLADSSFYNTSNSEYDSNKSGQFYWDPYTQGIIIGVKSLGNLLTHIPGGILAARYGGKWVFGLGILFMSLFSWMIPLVADIHVGCVIVVRFLFGVAEGVVGPASMALTARWVPPLERATFLGLIGIGAFVGAGLSNILAGVLASPYFGGWSTIFHLMGFLGVAFFCFWARHVFDGPESHPNITMEELARIKRFQRPQPPPIVPIIPWKKIAKSCPVWSSFIFQVCSTWFITTLTMTSPMYLDTVMRVPIQKNGFIVGFNYMADIVASFLAGFAVDYSIRKLNCGINSSRKFFAIFAVFGSFIGFASIPLFGGCNVPLVVTFIFVPKFFLSLNSGGQLPNLMDMAPRYAGVLGGVFFTLATPAAFFASILVGAALNDDVTRGRWTMIIFLASVVAVFGLVAFVLFGSAEAQPWAIENHPQKNEYENLDEILSQTTKRNEIR